MKYLLVFVALLIVAGITLFFLYNQLAATGNSNDKEIVMIRSDSSDGAAKELEDAGYIKSFTAFNLAYFFLGNEEIQSGGYYLSNDMNAIEIINKLNDGADLKLITFQEGLRKEQYGERLAKLFRWGEDELEEWNSLYSDENTDYYEGVYFPDTYLIPVDESPKQIADRMIANFNEKFAPYQEQALEQDIKWTSVLKLASLIEREAGGKSDMPIISGVIWNRLEEDQLLQIDAAIQYAIGKRNGEWWSVVTGSDIKNTDSPYNNYKYKGLPPTPIANPGIASIDAALNPEETDCFFYLHDRSKQIHCSITYEEHLENIDKYLN